MPWRRPREELEFLPPARQIRESPPPIAGRLATIAIIAVFAAAVLWASLGTLDVVTVAHGRIVPTGHSKAVQAPDAGIVRAIRAGDGQRVERGDLLIELDPTTAAADARRLEAEHVTAQVQAARLRALLEGGQDFPAPARAEARFVELQRRLLRDQRAEHEQRLAAARLLVEQRAAALRATRAGVERLEALVRIEAERAEAYQALLRLDYVARMQYLDVEARRVERVQELEAERERLLRDEAALAEARQQALLTDSEFRRGRLADLAEWEMREASLREEVVKAARRSAIQRITAPVAGVVQQLAVHTVGAVVVPAQPLLVIVPEGERLEVEAWVENKDIGFVRPGQAAEVKVETFPFTRYGTVPGMVVTVSGDAVTQEKGGLVYAARVAIEAGAIRVDERDMALTPGMVVTVEIRTGSRRIIEFFLSPLLQRAREALRER